MGGKIVCICGEIFCKLIKQGFAIANISFAEKHKEYRKEVQNLAEFAFSNKERSGLCIQCKLEKLMEFCIFCKKDKT